jgi:hypothetical protein
MTATYKYRQSYYHHSRTCQAGTCGVTPGQQISKRGKRQRQKQDGARAIGDARPSDTGTAEEAIDDRGQEKRPDDRRQHEAGEEGRVVTGARVVDADGAEGAPECGPVADVLRIGQRQQNARPQCRPVASGCGRLPHDELAGAGSPGVPGEPHEIRHARHADWNAKRVEANEQTDTREAQHRPERITRQRSDLHSQRGTKTSPDAMTQRRCEHRAWRRVEDKAHSERGRNSRQHLARSSP